MDDGDLKTISFKVSLDEAEVLIRPRATVVSRDPTIYAKNF